MSEIAGDRRRPLAGLRRARSVPPCATEGLTNAEREKRTSFSRSPPPLGRYHSPPPPTYLGGESPRYGGRGGPCLRPRVQGGAVRWTFKVPPWTRYLGEVPWQGTFRTSHLPRSKGLYYYFQPALGAALKTRIVPLLSRTAATKQQKFLAHTARGPRGLSLLVVPGPCRVTWAVLGGPWPSLPQCRIIMSNRHWARR